MPRALTELGRALRDTALDLRVEQRQLAHTFGVSRETLSRWINGRVVPTMDTRAQVLATLKDAPPHVRARLSAAFGFAPPAPPPPPAKARTDADAKSAIEAAVRTAADDLDVTARAVRDVLRAVLPRLREAGVDLGEVEAAVAREPARKPRAP